ncbi:MAG: zinc ribbon domain-containing protein [Candidatus Methanomethylicaceae archaeon]
MRRRLNQRPFRKLQSFVEYKVLRNGFETHYLPNTEDYESGVRGTSSTCPMCGGHNKPNGQVFICEACGFVGDRHAVAA